MSIERMEHVTVLVPAARRGEIVKWLYKRREVHLEPFKEPPKDWEKRFRPIIEDATGVEAEASRMHLVTSFLSEHTTKKPDFLASIFPVRILAREEEIHEAASKVKPDEISARCQRLREEIELASEQHELLDVDRKRFEELDFIKVEIRELRRLRHVYVKFAAAESVEANTFVEDERVRGQLVARRLAESKFSNAYVIAGSAGQAKVVREVMGDYGLRELPLPEIRGTIGDEVKNLEAALATIRHQEEKLREHAVELSENLTEYKLAQAYWESERTRTTQQSMMVASGNVFAARGYAKKRTLERLRRELEEAFPGAALVVTEAPEGEEPPVSLKWSRFVRPAGLLVRMFGLPRYKSFDPTPYLMFTFIIFFGMCFGDLLYGAMLVALAAVLKRRFKGQSGLVEFFRLFTYTGISTMVFGVLTGSWGADLASYFGEGNRLNELRLKLMLLDPLQKPMVGLGIAVGLGVLNQFYGLALRWLGAAWRGEFLAGFYDGGLWLIYFASLLAMAFSGAGALPPAVMPGALVALAASALGLVLTQGRDQKNWGGRLVTGAISLYGILGTYGTTSFIGDVLSYSRLLALGLTTSVIGMAFNIIGGFLKPVPYAGLVLFLLIVVAGHSFNFLMSILGSFVHPARLIFLEFFNRFYEGGGMPFRPFGFQSHEVELVENK